MKISDFLNSQEFIEAVGPDKAPVYRKHFTQLVQKAEVQEAAVDDEAALKKLKDTWSWSWCAFAFSFFWASYRCLRLGYTLQVLLYGCLLFGFVIAGMIWGIIYLWPYIGPYLAQYFEFDEQIPTIQVMAEFGSIYGGLLLQAFLFVGLIFGLGGRSLYLLDLLEDYREGVKRSRNSMRNLILSVCLMIGALGICYYQDIVHHMQDSLSIELGSHLPD